ncbi:MAG: DedA family protein [Candidatus Niyogibacteria bacterium]|nr:DedA family protein [Candidatus Niyogibacteria bacterium]
MDIPFIFIFLPLNSETALYTVLFLILIVSGFGIPIPEEATLFIGGYLAYLEFIDFWLAVYILTLGIIVADNAGYFFGRLAGTYLSEKLSRFKYANIFLGKTKNYFDKYGEPTVLFTRPLLGVRVLVPILAGNFKMNFFKFFIFDALGAIPWTFLLVSASYYFGHGLDFLTEVREIKYVILTSGIIGVLFLAARVIRKEKEKIQSEFPSE